MSLAERRRNGIRFCAIHESMVRGQTPIASANSCFERKWRPNDCPLPLLFTPFPGAPSYCWIIFDPFLAKLRLMFAVSCARVTGLRATGFVLPRAGFLWQRSHLPLRASDYILNFARTTELRFRITRGSPSR